MKLLIERPATESLRLFLQSPGELEAGGILVGSVLPDMMTVQWVSTPGPEDIRARHTFTKVPKHHQEFLRHCWCESGGSAHYLGEWHTHSNDPSPSDFDQQAMYKLYQAIRGYRTECRPLFALIVGYSEELHDYGTGLDFPLWCGILYPGALELQECPFGIVD